MSLSSYEDFVFSACHVDSETAAEHWRLVSSSLHARAEALGAVKELRIMGPDTDLRVSVEGRSWIAAEGRLPGQARATQVAPLEPPPLREPA